MALLPATILATKLITERIRKTNKSVRPISMETPPTPYAPRMMAITPRKKNPMAAFNIVDSSFVFHTNFLTANFRPQLTS